MCPSVFLCLSVFCCISLCISVFLSRCGSDTIVLYSGLCVSVAVLLSLLYPYLCLSVCPYTCLSCCRSVLPSIYLSCFLSVCVSIRGRISAVFRSFSYTLHAYVSFCQCTSASPSVLLPLSLIQRLSVLLYVSVPLPISINVYSSIGATGCLPSSMCACGAG